MARAMTKSQLIAKVAEKASITKKAAAEIVDFIAETSFDVLPGLKAGDSRIRHSCY